MQPNTKVAPPEPIALQQDFGTALDLLGIAEGPAWPDRFGEALREALAGAKSVPTLSLFAGGGGLDIGFHDAGFPSLEAIEVEPRYAASLEQNSGPGDHLDGTHVRCIDIRGYFAAKLAKSARFVIGGPPCQTFSAAGRRASGVLGTADSRGTLFEEYVRVLEEVEPDGFLFENVYGILGAQDGRAWKEILNAFQELGFNVSYRVLDSADYGVPQHRERLIVVGARDCQFRFPRPTHGPDSPLKHNFHAAGTAVQEAPHEQVPGPLRGRYSHLLEAVPPGLNYSFFTAEMGHPEPVFAWRSKFSDLLYKADPERPTRTIKAHGGQYTGPFSWENRPFSSAELKRLQTFPDSYSLAGGTRSIAEQIGNSVPPQLARVLALAVSEQLFGRRPPIPLSYLDDDESLGFRRRKRALTAHYRRVAEDALSKKAMTSRTSETSAGQRTKWRCLRTDFSWLESSRAQAGSTKVLVETRKHSLRITVGQDDLVTKVMVQPASEDEGWALPVDYVELRLGRDPWQLTAAWKALEEEIRERFGYADMVQASGYYTYSPKIAGIAVQKPQRAPWPLLSAVMAGAGVGITAPLKELIGAWGIEMGVSEARRQLQELKDVGFEIRSSRTNPQIKKGRFLIPYPFPTLTPESVQRTKAL